MHSYFDIKEGKYNIHCKLYCKDLKSIRRMVVFGHGFGGHKDNSAAEKFAERMLSRYEDCALLTFNWPSHGDDEKETLYLTDCSKYLEQVITYVKQNFPIETLYFYGTSFGGYLALKYIREHGNPFVKMGLRCPAVNMYEVLTQMIMSKEELERSHRGEIVSVGFDRKIMVSPKLLMDLKENDIQQWNYQEFADDILILHGTADEIVAFEGGTSFAKKNQITFIPVEGADHRFQEPEKMQLAIQHMLLFFSL